MTFTNGDTDNGATTKSVKIAPGSVKYHMQTLKTVLNSLAHMLIGLVCILTLFFAFYRGLPTSMTNIHIALTVIGYQFLMAQGILSLCPHNAWSAHLTLGHKKRIHWILQIMGSILAIAGSALYILNKPVHWNTLHGKYGLVALVFTIASLFNGVTSLYAFELRKVIPIPGKLSKLSHICFGIVAYAASSASLCYGYDKGFFKMYMDSDVNTYFLMGFTVVLTVVVILNPIITFVEKLFR
ncbi:unnamed protein product [Chrysodeixis includens]|uniref:ascorbate ferrireductase (transmembrane) n=1 Tax=Chrysodeixis includens TaxID=689277 RepID=A0A9P0C465_CHRIL|nr:unnamed protein product [Chrysodeixis includens]